MTDYCRQCSLRIHGRDHRDLARLCKPGETVWALCEGCGEEVEVNQRGKRTGKKYSAIVAGTGFEGRAARIRAYAKAGMPAVLKREPSNPHDANAIAVYITVARWYTLFRPVEIQIGYLKARFAATLSKRMDAGGEIISAKISSLYLALDHPRVSLIIVTDW
ncbi:HIRAN domain-containing protein [Salinicola aestuarinus]|uniref:HIRAN domain-containing protein n=1 Tax=Salinicola aestuarinus TaxID=1949082 RepID=UPI000DA20DBE|nr:HIRAN domain-containing protein [Salinicola aestuarinus]